VSDLPFDVQLSEFCPKDSVFCVNPRALYSDFAAVNEGPPFMAAHPATWARMSHEQRMDAWRRAVARLDLSEHPGTDATSANRAPCKPKEQDTSSVPDGEQR
jgi:hypothetical protein